MSLYNAEKPPPSEVEDGMAKLNRENASNDESQKSEQLRRSSSDLDKPSGSDSSANQEEPQKPSVVPQSRRKFSTQPRNIISRISGVPKYLHPPGSVKRTWNRFLAFSMQHLNFYRIHLLVFTFMPLIFSGIFYASNTLPIAYIDCLFVCVSAMTVTGLATINVSTATAWQQAILFFLMTIGNISAVSITMIWIRRHFFRVKFDAIVRKSAKARKRLNDVEFNHQKEKRKELIRLQRVFGLRKKNHKHEQEENTLEAFQSHTYEPSPLSSANTDEIAELELKAELAQKKKARFGSNHKKDKGSIRASMIRRMDQPAVLINPMGAVSTTVPERDASVSGGGILNTGNATAEEATSPNIRIEEPSHEIDHSAIREGRRRSTISFSGNGQPSSESNNFTRHKRRGSDPSTSEPPTKSFFPRAQTIEFADSPAVTRTSALPSAISYDTGLRHRTNTGIEMERSPTVATQRSFKRTGTTFSRVPTTSKERGFGGFPTPLEIVGHAFKRALPQVQERFKRSTTIPRTATFVSTHSAGEGSGMNVRDAPYLSFDATVSRNSRFHELTEAQRDELGGVEYRAIDLLAKIIPIYWLGINFFMIVLVAPWLASSSARKVHDVIAGQGVDAPNTTWFWFFQVISAYSNTGLSLIDTSMTLLPDQYLMLIPMAFLILAGNTAFPIILRFFIWILSILTPRKSRTYETLRFLLDHPRRCFVYLFPSAQTWFLFGILLVFNCFDWIMFQVLDLGNQTIEAWPLGQRIFDGLFQSIAVRAAGFQIISLLLLAPAVQFLYIIMMYISAYPVAMSVRNTNVYEERSLGIFKDDSPGTQDEPSQGGARVWGTYLAAHARRQLAFDMWWLGFALWLVCIIERDQIQDPTTDSYFTVFSCLFELTSAYGTVGLSTGIPTENYSLSGQFHTLSKLVVCAVMLRGRHRGLPVAIDRAVLLPDEAVAEDEAQEAAYTIDEDGFIRTRSSYPVYELDDEDREIKRRPSIPIDQNANKGDIEMSTYENSPLAAIREHSGGTPLSTPTPSQAIQRTTSYGMPLAAEIANSGSNSSNHVSSSASEKGKAREKEAMSEEECALRYGSLSQQDATDLAKEKGT